jgi:hypothetical protein
MVRRDKMRAVTLGRVQNEDLRRLAGDEHSRRPSDASAASNGMVPKHSHVELTRGDSERFRKTLELLGVKHTSADVPTVYQHYCSEPPSPPTTRRETRFSNE